MATYYVRGANATTGPAGSDSNPGTQSAPWRTVKAAFNGRLSAGDQLYGDGEFKEMVSGLSSIKAGTSGSKIRVNRWPGAAKFQVVGGISFFYSPGITHWIKDEFDVTWDDTRSNNDPVDMVKIQNSSDWEWKNSDFSRSICKAAVQFGSNMFRGHFHHNRLWNAREVGFDTGGGDGTNQDHLMYVSSTPTNSDTIIERNLFWDSVNGRAIKIGPGSASSSPIGGCTIRFNTMWDNLGPSNIQFSYGATNNVVYRNILIKPDSGYRNITAYNTNGSNNQVHENVGWESVGVVDSASAIVTNQGGPNLHRNPQIISTNPASSDFLKPADATSQAYGYYASGDTEPPPSDPPPPTTEPDTNDTFTRTVASGGWGTPDTGGAWAVKAAASSTFSVDGDEGVITPASDTQHLIVAGSSTTNDALEREIRFIVDFQDNMTSVLGVGRYQVVSGDTQYYRVGLERSGSNMLLKGQVRNNANSSGLDIWTAVNIGSYAAGAWEVRVWITGASPTRIRAKAWQVSAGRPPAWQADEEDSVGPQLAGLWGIRYDPTAGLGVCKITSFSALAPAIVTPIITNLTELTGTSSDSEPVITGNLDGDFEIDAASLRMEITTDGVIDDWENLTLPTTVPAVGHTFKDYTSAALPDGVHSWRFQAQNPAHTGAQDTDPVGPVTIDTDNPEPPPPGPAPSISNLSVPTDPTTATTYTPEFDLDGTVDLLESRLGGSGSWTDISAEIPGTLPGHVTLDEVTGLSLGAQIYEIRATDTTTDPDQVDTASAVWTIVSEVEAVEDTSSGLILDPSEVAINRTELDINLGAIRVREEGIDWGDAAIEAYMAEAQTGQVPVDFRVPNRIITIPLTLGVNDPDGYSGARSQLQQKVALFQREGGWIKRSAGRYADVVNATLSVPDRWGIRKSLEIDVTLTLEAIPDFYGDEIQLSDHAETTDTEVIFTETGILGDYPARCRIVVDDDQAQPKRGLIWGIRSRHYSSAATAALAYEAEDMTLLGSADLHADADASGGSQVRHAITSTSWVPVLRTDLDGVGALTHTGTYRAWVRAADTGSQMRFRLVWGVGGLSLLSENPSVTVPASDGYFLIDLGEVRLDAAPVGTHFWQGVIQAAAVNSGESGYVFIDKVYLVPVDDGYGTVRGGQLPTTPVIGNSAFDAFASTTSGNDLSGRTPPLGAAWVTAGATTDFKFIDAEDANTNPTEAVSRSAASADIRFGVLGSNMTDQQVSAVCGIESEEGHFGPHGIVARYVDADNNLRLTTYYTPGNSFISSRFGIRIEKEIATTVTTIAEKPLPNGLFYRGYPYMTLTLVARANGVVNARAEDSNGAILAELAASDSALATGGTLASGKAGIFDSGNSDDVFERWYDDVTVSVPTAEPRVIEASQSVEVSSAGVFVEGTTGGYSPAAHVTGGLPYLPPAGLEQRTIEVFVKTSRGNLDQISDDGIDDASVRVYYRPGYLFLHDLPDGE